MLQGVRPSHERRCGAAAGAGPPQQAITTRTGYLLMTTQEALDLPTEAVDVDQERVVPPDSVERSEIGRHTRLVEILGHGALLGFQASERVS